MANRLIWTSEGSLRACQWLEGNRWLVLVDRGTARDAWVVATYQSGCGEWEAGRYFDDHENAGLIFDQKIGDWNQHRCFNLG